MTRNAIHRRLAVLFCALIPAVAAAAGEDWHRIRPVAVQGAEMAAFLGEPLEYLSLVRYDQAEGTWHSVPFQWDERDGSGMLQIQGNGSLDEDDELVFFENAAGDSAPPTEWTGDDGFEQRIQLTLRESISGPRRWLYLVRSQAPGHPALITADPQGEWFFSPVYTARYGPGGLLDSLLIRKSAGGDSLDLLDLKKLRLHLRITEYGLNKTVVIKESMDEDIQLLPGVSLRVTSGSGVVRTGGSGAVRLWRRNTLKIRAFGNVLGNRIEFEDSLHFIGYLYPSRIDWIPEAFEIPAFSEGSVERLRISFDGSVHAMGMTFFNPANPEGEPVDLFNRSLNDSIVWPGTNWMVVTGNPDHPYSVISRGSLLTLWHLHGAPPNGDPRLFYRDHFYPESHDTGDRRSYGDHGIEVTGSSIEGRVEMGVSGIVVPDNMDFEQAAELASLQGSSPDCRVRVQERVHVYALILDSSPQGLPVYFDGDMGITPYRVRVEENRSYTLQCDSMVEETGIRHLFERWDHDSSRVVLYQTPGRDDTLTAWFSTQYYLQLDAQPGGAGTLNPPAPGLWVDRDSSVTVTAEPLGWYDFLYWTGDAAGTENPQSVAMTRPKSITAHFGNRTPEVALPDTLFAEDDTLTWTWEFILARTEDNNPDSVLTVLAESGTRISAEVDTAAKTLKMFSHEPHWFGVDSIRVGVRDPLEETGWDLVVIEILPVPDPPLPFALTHPPDGWAAVTMPQILEFEWEEAADPDPGDTLSYVFQLDTDSSFTGPDMISRSGIADNRLTLPWPGEFMDGRYYWRVLAVDRDSLVTPCIGGFFTFYLATGTGGENDDMLPRETVLNQNYPNPFNAQTVVHFALSESADVWVVVYNMFGQQVRVLIQNMVEPGFHAVVWDGTDAAGKPVSTGVYFIMMQAGPFRDIRRAILIR